MTRKSASRRQPFQLKGRGVNTPLTGAATQSRSDPTALLQAIGDQVDDPNPSPLLRAIHQLVTKVHMWTPSVDHAPTRKFVLTQLQEATAALFLVLKQNEETLVTGFRLAAHERRVDGITGEVGQSHHAEWCKIAEELADLHVDHAFVSAVLEHSGDEVIKPGDRDALLNVFQSAEEVVAAGSSWEELMETRCGGFRAAMESAGDELSGQGLA